MFRCDLNATNFTSKSEDQTPTRESLNENSDECQSTTERGKGGGGSTTSNSEDSEAFEDLVGEIKYLKVPIDDQFSSDIMLHFPGAIAFIGEQKFKKSYRVQRSYLGVNHLYHFIKCYD